MSNSERGIIGRIQDRVKSFRRGYTQAELETQQRYAYGEITPGDILSYRARRREEILKGLSSTGTRGGMAMPGMLRMTENSLRGMNESPDDHIMEQMRAEAKVKLVKWGKTF